MRLTLAILVLLVLGILGSPADAARAEEGAGVALPRPYAIQPQVRFWKRVYTEVDTSGGLVHDREHLDVVYDVLRFPDDLSPGEQQERADERKAYYRSVLLRLADGPREGLSREELRVLRLWPKGVASETLRAAAENVRFQLGQANRFREGIVRSGAWEDHIREVLAKHGVPQELVALPHVESSYNPLAYSKVGAAGLWQFMPSTGRRFLRVDDVVDERFDPWRASEAAARYLAENHRVTGAWPLAITGYNHGAGGMRKAAQQLGTTDIGVIVRRYKGANFGFASRNFYASFLAAADIDASPEKYFGPLKRAERDDSRVVVLQRSTSVGGLERSLGVSSGILRELNLALREPFWTGRRHAPPGVVVRVPRSVSTDDANAQLASAMVDVDAVSDPEPEPERVAAPAKKSAKKASASKSGGAEKASAATKKKSPASPKVASRTHRVRPGETVSALARRYGVTEKSILAANGLRSGRSLKAGQTLKIPARRASSDEA